MKYAIIGLNGKQYQVQEGQNLKVDSLRQEEGKLISPERVLLLSDEEGILVGEPGLDSVDVSLKVTSNLKDKKISVRRYRSKSRYRKSKGHRQPITTLVVSSISRAPAGKKASVKGQAVKSNKSKVKKEV